MKYSPKQSMASYAGSRGTWADPSFPESFKEDSTSPVHVVIIFLIVADFTISTFFFLIELSINSYFNKRTTDPLNA